MKQEGNIDYHRGTPLALSDGTPVVFLRTAISPLTRWKYGCIIEHKAGDKVAWFDKDGSAQSGGLRLRNVAKQVRYDIVGKSLSFYHRDQAIRFATSAGLASPEGVVEVTVGENGVVLGRALLAV